MRRRLREIVRKEFIQTLREPRMRMMLLVPPVMQLILFGFAVNLDVENARIGWMDLDRTPASRGLLASFEGSRNFQLVATPGNQRELQDLLDRGEVQAVVSVLPGFARDLARGRTAAVQVLVDGANSNTASLLAQYASQVLAAFAAERMPEMQRRGMMARGAPAPVAIRAPEVRSEARVWFNPEMKSRNYFVPGVLVNIITIVTLTLTALAIVREKELGTMEQLMVTPIRPFELIAGKLIPFACVGLFDLVLVTGVALLVFHIPFRGSPLLLLVCAMAFLLNTLGIGLFLSTVSKTQQQAMMSGFFFITPAFMLSGFTFPIHNMPLPVQYLTYLNPLRYFMEIVRGIFLKGVGLEILWPQLAALAVYGAAIMALSTLRFHKRLE